MIIALICEFDCLSTDRLSVAGRGKLNTSLSMHQEGFLYVVYITSKDTYQSAHMYPTRPTNGSRTADGTLPTKQQLVASQQLMHLEVSRMDRVGLKGPRQGSAHWGGWTLRDLRDAVWSCALWAEALCAVVGRTTDLRRN